MKQQAAKLGGNAVDAEVAVVTASIGQTSEGTEAAAVTAKLPGRGSSAEPQEAAPKEKAEQPEPSSGDSQSASSVQPVSGKAAAAHRAHGAAAAAAGAMANSSSQPPEAEEEGEAERQEEEEGEEGEGEEEGGGEEGEDEAAVEEVILQLRQMLSVKEEVGVALARQTLFSPLDITGIAGLIASGRAKRIICMCGAGISVNAGIPDFRSPGTGLYNRLQEYNLPYPQAVFEIDFFKKNPQPFLLLSKELSPGQFKPTRTHYFMRLLHEKGLLLRCYTQNIDSLERLAGLPPSMIVPAHGNWDTASCIKCKYAHDPELMLEAARDATPVYCSRKGCRGLVKPDIVFFGENLPQRFWQLVPQDFPQADLLIVMGTSLVVHPFAGLIDKVGPEVPRLLINKEMAGELDIDARLIGLRQGFDFHPSTSYRDALHLGDCDEGVRQLAEQLGWAEDLEALVSGGSSSSR